MALSEPTREKTPPHENLIYLIGIDTHEVLEAAGTKWNFLPFKPGRAWQYYAVKLQPLDQIKDVDAVILAVMPRSYLQKGIEGIAGRCADCNALVIDVKGCFSKDQARKLGVTYWRL